MVKVEEQYDEEEGEDDDNFFIAEAEEVPHEEAEAEDAMQCISED